MKRYGSVIGLRPEGETRYRELHAAVWPAVLERLAASHIHNYSIFLRDGILFSYFEYHGDDYAADMAAVAADPVTQEWWTHTDPLQEPILTAGPGEHWAPLEEVFHVD